VVEDECGEQAPRAPDADDIALLIRIRCEEGDALRDFVRRFRPLLLDQARRLGVERSERETVVMSFMDDVLLKLAHMRAPRSLATFVVTSFRNAMVEAWRADAGRTRRDINACELISGERVVSATCSAFALRAALGPEGDAPQAAAPVAALMKEILRGCTDEERSVLVWSSHRVPLRAIAGWLGISYAAARQRSARLRTRLARESIQQLTNLHHADSVVITRLLRRAGVKMDEVGQTGGAAA